MVASNLKLRIPFAFIVYEKVSTSLSKDLSKLNDAVCIVVGQNVHCDFVAGTDLRSTSGFSQFHCEHLSVFRKFIFQNGH